MQMAKVQLFCAPKDDNRPAVSSLCDRVEVTLGEILPILIDACLTRRAWIRDFYDEALSISRDLYEVLIAYKAIRKNPA
ncbi:MAG: hypothetical protein NZ899_00850 [Thermoguttaceae bacterium]|nr:hypothetical protein [Thermoguttaceae bacterium]MDW8077442.1 hypothetical protein [Thermoguttaceae bacterium]